MWLWSLYLAEEFLSCFSPLHNFSSWIIIPGMTFPIIVFLILRLHRFVCLSCCVPEPLSDVKLPCKLDETNTCIYLNNEHFEVYCKDCRYVNACVCKMKHSPLKMCLYQCFHLDSQARPSGVVGSHHCLESVRRTINKGQLKSSSTALSM